MDPISFLIRCATHAAGSQLRTIQQSKDRAEAGRIAAQEKAREARDPQYLAERDAARPAEAARQTARQAAYPQERALRSLQTLLFWLSFLSGGLAFLAFLGEGNGTAQTVAWLGFGAAWLYLCFKPKHHT